MMSETSSTAPTGPPKRPFALKAINALLLLRGTLYALTFVIVTLAAWSGDETMAVAELIEAGIVALFMGVLNLALAVGMWRLRPWAWRLTIITAGVLLVIDLWGYFESDRNILESLGLLLNILIVFYLAQTDVRRLFAATLPGDAPPEASEAAPVDSP